MPASDASDLRVSVMRLARRLRRERADHGLTLGQLSALVAIERHGPLTAGGLAAHEGIRPPSATRTIASLTEAGYVTRATGDADRRQCLVALTDSGRAVLAGDRQRRDAFLARALEDLSDADRATLLAAAPLLDRLAAQ